MNEDVKQESVHIHSRADELIACLEGEIAKRDETIARLVPPLNRAVQANYDLREELAACRVAVENCDLFRARIAELEARIVWLECEAQVNAAPVSEAKAQAVVMPEQDGSDAQIAFWAGFEFAVCGLHNGNIRAAWNDFKGSEQFKRLNAAPVQQVSVPDGWRLVPVEPTPKMIDATWYHEIDMSCGIESQGARNKRIYEAMLNAAPAAPAADAGLVEALEHARLFIVNGIDLGFIQMPEAGTPDPAHETLPMIDAALAAHRAKDGE